jgi:hypothetical protein
LTQPKISRLRRHDLRNISVERLLDALVSFDQSIDIVIRPAQKPRPALINVAS